GIIALRTLRNTADPVTVRAIISWALPPLLATALTSAEFELIHRTLTRLPEPPARPQLTKDDWGAALGVLLLVFLSTFPVVIPFLFVNDAKLALRLSNGIALLMLFVTGYAFGKYSGRHPWLTGLAVVLIGSALVGIAIALGG